MSQNLSYTLDNTKVMNFIKWLRGEKVKDEDKDDDEEEYDDEEDFDPVVTYRPAERPEGERLNVVLAYLPVLVYMILDARKKKKAA